MPIQGDYERVTENQRAFFRIDAIVPAVVRRVDCDGQPWDEFPAETVDLSAGGTLITAAEFVPAGHTVDVELLSTSPPLDLTGRGRVVRSWRRSGGSWLSAVCFERLSGHSERQLLQFCFLKEREMAERVSNVRIEIAIPTRLERADGSMHRASTVNISADAARVTAAWEADRGEAVYVMFSEEWFGRELRMQAHVGRRDERSFDLEFEAPTRADRAAINQLIMAEERKRRTAA